jgi:hypothetical protein
MKKILAVFVVACMLAISSVALAGTNLDGDFDQTQGGIDFYIENAAIAIGKDIAASTDMIVVQGSMMHQDADAYANAEDYYYHYYRDYDYYNYNDYYQTNYSDAVDGSILVAPSQVQEKLTVVSTGFGTLQMYQLGVQGGVIDIQIDATPNYEYHICGD